MKLVCCRRLGVKRKGGSKWTEDLVRACAGGFTVNFELELALEAFCFSGLRPGLEDVLLGHLLLSFGC